MKTAEIPNPGRIWFEAQSPEEIAFIASLQTHLERGRPVKIVMVPEDGEHSLQFMTKKAY